MYYSYFVLIFSDYTSDDSLYSGFKQYDNYLTDVMCLQDLLVQYIPLIILLHSGLHIFLSESLRREL